MDTAEEYNAAKKNDPYCQYEKLPILLKRFSFEEKMRIATIASSKSICFTPKTRGTHKRQPPLPWCLETFVMLSMEANEYADGDFRGKNENKFIKMCNTIWAASAIVCQIPSGNYDFIDIFLASTGLNQFHMQESARIKQYRYWCIFNDNSAPVHMKSLFYQKMGTIYEDYLLLSEILQLLLIAQSENQYTMIPQAALTYLLHNRFSEAAKHLKITRSEYIELQRKFVADSDDPYKYVYSLCPSNQYAFVEAGRLLYFPLPHLLDQCVTSSLLYRMTEGDNDLRKRIGKYIWEPYLFRMVRDSGAYQEVFQEQEYTYSGSKAFSPDVLAQHEQQVLFIDSKSTVPSLGIRLFDLAAYENNIHIVAENIKKLYNQMQRFDQYNPFCGKVSLNRDDYWGIVIVLEDAYIRRIRYYEAARDKIKIKEDSDDWRWLITHIKVISLYEVERLCLSGNSLIDACRQSFQEDPFEFTFTDFPTHNSIAKKDFDAFCDMLHKKAWDITMEMKQQGLL